MTIKLLPGADREGALSALVGAANALGAQTSAHPRHYISWAIDQARMLSNCFPSEVVADLILTPRYLAIQQAGVASFATDTPPPLILLMNSEVNDQRRRLEEAATQLRREMALWDNCPGRVLVPDTNVFLQHRNKFDEIPWRALAQARTYDGVIVVVPMIVIRELDGKKKSRDTRWRAAYSLSKIEALFGNTPVADSWQLLDGQEGSVALRVLVDELGHSSLPRPDDEIIVQALTVKTLTARPVQIVTFDTGMAFESRQAGLGVLKLGESDRPDGWKVEPTPADREQKATA